jgi:hypothetical protein
MTAKTGFKGFNYYNLKLSLAIVKDSFRPLTICFIGKAFQHHRAPDLASPSPLRC